MVLSIPTESQNDPSNAAKQSLKHRCFDGFDLLCPAQGVRPNRHPHPRPSTQLQSLGSRGSANVLSGDESVVIEKLRPNVSEMVSRCGEPIADSQSCSLDNVAWSDASSAASSSATRCVENSIDGASCIPDIDPDDQKRTISFSRNSHHGSGSCPIQGD